MRALRRTVTERLSLLRGLVDVRRRVERNSPLSMASTADIAAIRDALRMIELRLSRLENLSQGAKAVYVGNDRVLVKANFLDIVYLVEADDRLIVPRFIMNGVHEPEITSFFIRNIGPEDNALDLGANFGYYSCLMGRCAHRGKTIAL